MHVDFLVQIDKLVQLIESPIFTCELMVILILNVAALSFSHLQKNASEFWHSSDDDLMVILFL